MDPELKQHLEIISSKLEDINKTLNPNRFQLFLQGLWRAFGYLIGLVLATVLITWALNILGVISFLQDISDQLLNALNNINSK